MLIAAYFTNSRSTVQYFLVAHPIPYDADVDVCARVLVPGPRKRNMRTRQQLIYSWRHVQALVHCSRVSSISKCSMLAGFSLVGLAIYILMRHRVAFIVCNIGFISGPN